MIIKMKTSFQAGGALFNLLLWKLSNKKKKSRGKSIMNSPYHSTPCPSPVSIHVQFVSSNSSKFKTSYNFIKLY